MFSILLLISIQLLKGKPKYFGLRLYNEEIDKTIIEILYQNGERTSGKLKEDVEMSLKHTLSFETYSYRLIAMLKPYRKESRYIICPILNKRDEGRGKNVFYSLTRDAKIRYSLSLPILKTDSIIEKAYRLIFYYIIFGYNQSIKLKNEDEYNTFLEKLHINKNELIISTNSKFKEFKITKLTHPESEIEFTRKDYLKSSGKKERYEYSYILPGFSPSDFLEIKKINLPYQHEDFTKDKVIHYFNLLEKQNLIKKIKLKELLYLDKETEIYTLFDNSLRHLLADCSTLQSYIHTYFEYIWKSTRKSTDEERIWFEHLWGKERRKKWFIECNNKRRVYQKENKNHVLKETQDRINSEKKEIINKFESIKKEHTKAINDYSYFTNPLLNIVYPLFLRKEFNQ